MRGFIRARHARTGRCGHWRRRSWPTRREDVEFLLPAWEVLRDGLRSRERESWLDMETQARLAAVGTNMQEPSWWRVSGARGLHRRSLAAARELYHWREDDGGRAQPAP